MLKILSVYLVKINLYWAVFNLVDKEELQGAFCKRKTFMGKTQRDQESYTDKK